MPNQRGKLHNDLKVRHVSMIAIGGVIGSGLFIGSGDIIRSTGPSVLLSYLIACLIVVFVMRMLGEMAVVNPDSGSFSTYAHQAIGPWAGFTIGWLYWFNWVILIAIESTLSGTMIHDWFPFIPVWVVSLGLPILMMINNMFSVKSFGELEYWIALIKVITIIGFLCLGVAMILGLVPGFKSPGLSNLTGNGGFFPKGFSPVLLSAVFVMFSISGSEVAAIAAGESDNPKKNVIRAINSVVWRLLIFFVFSVALLVIIIPWNDTHLLKYPYASVFKIVGIPAAALIVNIVVLSAAISITNSGIYTSSRMLYSLAQKGDAPSLLLRVTKRGAPIWAILMCVFFSYVCQMFKFVSPNTLYVFLADSSGGVTILTYVLIAFSHLYMRRKTEKENPGALKVKMWLFPYLTYLVIAMLLAIYITQAFVGSMRMQFILTSVITIIVIGFYLIFFRKNRGPSIENVKKVNRHSL